MGWSGSSNWSIGRLCMRFGTDEPGKFERAVHRFLSELRHAQDEKRDQGDGDLNADCILGDADEAPDPKRLLDPAEEQFDLPALLVEFCNLFSGASRSLVTIRNCLPLSMITQISRTGTCSGLLRVLASRAGR